MPWFRNIDAQRLIDAIISIQASLSNINARLSSVEKKEIATMSQLSDFATQIKTKLDAEQDKIQALSDRITAILSNSTTLSDADRAALQALSDEVDAHGTELDNLATNTVAPLATP